MVQDQPPDPTMKLPAGIPVIRHAFHPGNILVQGMFQVVQVVRVLIITMPEQDHLHPVQDTEQVQDMAHQRDLLQLRDHITVVL